MVYMAGEPEKHHGKTKTEVPSTGNQAGKYFEYTFTGTGIEVMHRNMQTLQVMM